MKYAALIFGDDDRHQPKKAAEKSSPEPGQIVRHIDGSVYRVASKIAGPDGIVVKLANLQGKSVQTPQNFRPVGIAVAHFASWLKYHLAYQKDFDLYVNSYIEQYNNQHKNEPLPYPVGHDGLAFRWANWFQSVVSPKLYVRGRGTPEDQQAVKDDIIHEMLFNTLGERNVLDQFAAKAKKLGVNKHNAAKKLTDFLISTFMYRIDEMQNKLNARSPEEEISMYQPGMPSDEGEAEVNILETEQYGVGESEFQSAEARRDVGKFREAFRKWLLKPNVAGQKGGENFILMFDIFWRLLQDTQGSDEIKRSELEQEWMDKTGLSFGSFKDYFTRLPEMVENFIVSHGTELGDTNIFIDLMNTIREDRKQREQREREEARKKERRLKERARPAMVSSLNTAGIEGDFAEAISNSENPDVVDPDIKQPTESVSEAAKVSAEDAPNDPPGYAARVRELEAEGMTTSDAQAVADAEFAKKSDLFAEEGPKEVKRIKRITSHAGLYRYMSTLEETGLEIAKIKSIPSPYAYSPTHTVYQIPGGPEVIIVETAHKTYDVFELPLSIPRMPKQASSSKIAKLLRGDQLTPEQVKQVQNAFIYRWTTENKRRGDVYHCDKCDVRNNPYVNTQSAEGHQHPTIPLQTDQQWLAEHAFYFTNADKLQPKRHAQPAYLGEDLGEHDNALFASVAHKFAMEKTAYNPGMGQYIYQADVFCEDCGGNIKRMLDKKGYTPQNPSDESSYDSDRYPKGPYYNQESDGPEHCSRCGKFLENPLTTEGYRYLNEMILEADEQGRGDDEVIQEWKAFYPERESDEYVPAGAVSDALGDVEKDTDTDFLKNMNTSSLKTASEEQFLYKKSPVTRIEERGELSRIFHEGRDEDDAFWVKTNLLKPVPKKKETGVQQALKNDPEALEMFAKAFKDNAGRIEISSSPATVDQVSTNVSANSSLSEIDAIDYVRVVTDRSHGAKYDILMKDNLPEGLADRLGVFFSTKGLRARPGEVQINSRALADWMMSTHNVLPVRVYGGQNPVTQKEGMLGHDFYNADGQAINDETNSDTGRMPHQYDTTELKKGAADQWRCEDCGQKGGLDPKGGGCATCGSQAVSLVPREPSAEIVDKQAPVVRETKPIEVEKRMIPRRSPKPLPLSSSDKTAQGSGNTTVTMQNQNVTNPSAPGKGEPMAVPEAIDQQAGPHSPNAPMTAPRTPGIQPKIVNVPPGTEGEGEVMASKQALYLEDPDPELETGLDCPRCHGGNIDISPTEEGYDIYCEDCEQVTHSGLLVPAHGGGTMGEHAVEQEFIDPDLEMEPEESPFDEHEAAGDSLFEEQPVETVGDLDVLFNLPQEKKEEWLVAHGWVKDESWHGASWWMQKPMWTKEGHEEDIPYQETDDAMQKELELSDAEEEPEVDEGEMSEEEIAKEGAGSNSGEDDPRGVGDLYRENFYEHRTEGLSTDGMLSGMKGAGGYSTVDEYARITAPQVLKNYVAEGGNMRDRDAVIAYTKANYRPEPLLIVEVMKLLPKTAAPVALNAPAPVVSPNVQQNMNLVRPQPQPAGPGGTTVAITPSGSPQEETNIGRHTVEPEIPNAKYHMMGSLIAAEEERLAKLAGLEES